MTEAHAKVREWSRRFRHRPLASRVVTALDHRSGEIWRRTFDLLQRESPEYRNAIDDEFTKESQSHCRELLGTIIAVAAGRAGKSAADPFAFVRAHAEWRARHNVPLTASLHAYRLAHKTYSEITREDLLRHREREEVLASLGMLSDFWLEFFDYVGAVLAETHAAEEKAAAARSSGACGRLIEQLLRGVQPKPADAQRLETACGIRREAPLAVAVALPLPARNGKPIDLDVARRSVARLFDEALPAAFGRMVEIRNDEVRAIVSSDRDPSRGLAKALRRYGKLPRIGVSRDACGIHHLPAAYEEARAALEFTAPDRPLLHFADIGLMELLTRRADRMALALVPDGARSLLPVDDLTGTLRSFAECSLNVKATAQRLGVHPNTVYFRLNRIRHVTGIDPRTFSGVTLLLTSLRLLESSTPVI